MQILGAAGKMGAGKTTLLHHVIEQVLGEVYGKPILLSYAELSADSMGKELVRLRDLEFRRLDDTSDELFVLIDDVRYPEQVEQIHAWGGNIIFVCADARLKDLAAPYRDVEEEKMANRYTTGESSDNFDFCITNYNNEERFKEETSKFMYMFLGGDASYEAGLF